MVSFPRADGALIDDVEIWFERQPVDVARIAGIDFGRMDNAVAAAAAAAPVGGNFVASIPGWGIHCERARERRVRVLKVVPGRDALAPGGWID